MINSKKSILRGGTRMEETISLKEIFDVIRKKLLLIISIMVGAALIAAIVSFFILTPIYESSTQFIVNQSNENTSEDMQIDSNTIRTNVELINTYNVVITSSAILNDVIDKLELPYSSDTLANKIQVSSEQDSQVVTVTVKDPNPTEATDIANTVVAVFQEEIVDLMNVDNVKVLSEAVTKDNPTPVEPKPTLNIAIALVLGAMVGVGVAFLLEYFDTTIKTEEDIEKKLGITLIGVVSTMDPEDIRQRISQPPKQGGIRNVRTKKTNTY